MLHWWNNMVTETFTAGLLSVLLLNAQHQDEGCNAQIIWIFINKCLVFAQSDVFELLLFVQPTVQNPKRLFIYCRVWQRQAKNPQI